VPVEGKLAAQENPDKVEIKGEVATQVRAPAEGKVKIDGLVYNIQIVLPESRDQAVYDALFRSLREHLG
jgi:hypothetical protein